MKIGIIQSNYIPWRGYFDFIREVDAFVIHDDIQYTKGDWRNRNKIKTPAGAKWLTVPVHYDYTAQLIQDVRIDDSTMWWDDHINQFRENYREAPYYDAVYKLLVEGGTRNHQETISALNRDLIHDICQYLNIQTPLYSTASMRITGVKTERIIQICKYMGATEYLSGPAAKCYLDEDALRQAGIEPMYKTYDYSPYPQLYGAFDGNLSILDLIANVGPNAPKYIWGKSNYSAGLGGD